MIRIKSTLAAIAAALMFPTVAFAQATAAVASADAPWWQKMLLTAFAAFGTAVAGLLGKLLHYLADLAAQKSKLAWLARLDESIMAVVNGLAATVVQSAKQKTADGKLTKAEAEQFKRDAVQALKNIFTVKTLMKVLGAQTSDELDKALGDRVEVAVTRTKALAAAGKA